MTPIVCPHLDGHDGPEFIRVTRGGWKPMDKLRGGAPREKRGSAKTVYDQFDEIEAAYLRGEAITAIAGRYGSTFYSVARALAEAGHDVGKV